MKNDDRKNITVYIYNSDLQDKWSHDDNFQNILSNVESRISTNSTHMISCIELADCNPQAKACWEVKPDIEIPSIESLPYTIIFTIDDRAFVVILEHYNDIEKDHTTSFELENGIGFHVYRSNEDKYIMTAIHLIEF
jgi:hypothetical protein